MVYHDAVTRTVVSFAMKDIHGSQTVSRVRVGFVTKGTCRLPDDVHAACGRNSDAKAEVLGMTGQWQAKDL